MDSHSNPPSDVDSYSFECALNEHRANSHPMDLHVNANEVNSLRIQCALEVPCERAFKRENLSQSIIMTFQVRMDPYELQQQGREENT